MLEDRAIPDMVWDTKRGSFSLQKSKNIALFYGILVVKSLLQFY